MSNGFTASGHRAIAVSAPARLHLGFLDPGGAGPRRFGSIGLTLDGIATRLAVTPAAQAGAEGPHGDRVLGYLKQLEAVCGAPLPLHARVVEAIPAHSGLGSGTQLALAVGRAVAMATGVELDCRTVAHVLARGGRSGIGIGAFEQGGFMVDGGRGPAGGPAPVISRLPFPAAWRILLVFDPHRPGLHGAAETAAFRALPPFPADATARLCRLVLMEALPALAEADLPAFGAAISELQRRVGDHFAPAQGGRYASNAVAEAVAWLEGQGACGIGQSSWGPTGFALFADADRAHACREAAAQRFAGGAGLVFRVCSGRNRGADAGPGGIDRATSA